MEKAMVEPTVSLDMYMYLLHTLYVYILYIRGGCRPNLDLCQIGVSQCDAGRSCGLLKKDMGSLPVY